MTTSTCSSEPAVGAGDRGELGVVAVVPARAGSRRLPGKNLLKVEGRTLVEHAIDCGLNARSVDRVVLTTDDPEVLRLPIDPSVVRIERPPELATDSASTSAVLHDVITRTGVPRVVVLLQPTSPLRTPEDVDRTVDALLSHRGTPSVATAARLEHPLEWCFDVSGGEIQPIFGWEPFTTRSQDLPTRYTLNGAVYAVRGDHVSARGPLVGPGTRIIEMPASRSVDVDTYHDYLLVSALTAVSRHGQPPLGGSTELAPEGP